MRTVLKKEGFSRQIDRRKPALSEANTEKRLAWTEEYKDWTEE